METCHSSEFWTSLNCDQARIIVSHCGLATIPVALAEIYRSHAFEKHFGDFIREKTAEIGEGGEAEMSSPVAITS